MKKVEVLGTGCAKCKKTTAIVEQELKTAGIEAEVVKVEDVEEIVKRGVMMTPAVVVDGEVKSSGKVPSKKEILSWFE